MEEQGKGRNKLTRTFKTVGVIGHLVDYTEMLPTMQTFIYDAVNNLFALSGIAHTCITAHYYEYRYVQSVNHLDLKMR